MPTAFKPERFGSYLLLDALGKGSRGVVYVARADGKEDLCALKRLKWRAETDPVELERFRHEGALGQRLRHPNLANIIDVGRVDGRPYLASELVWGIDLNRVSASISSGVPIGVGVRALVDLLTAVGYIHSATEHDGAPLNLIHRDISPGNVLFGYDGRVRLADFGAAKSVLTEGSRLTSTGLVLGTARYIAPERLYADQESAASDLYSVGAVAYRMFLGEGPYDGRTSPAIIAQVLKGPPRPLAEQRRDLPNWLAEVVDGLMQREPARRPASARDLALKLARRSDREGVLATGMAVAGWLAVTLPEERTASQAMLQRARLMSTRSLPKLHKTEIFRIAPNGPIITGPRASGPHSGVPPDHTQLHARSEEEASSGAQSSQSGPQLLPGPLMPPLPPGWEDDELDAPTEIGMPVPEETESVECIDVDTVIRPYREGSD